MEVTRDTQTPVSIISIVFFILVHLFGTNKDNLFNSESFLGFFHFAFSSDLNK